MYRTAPTLQLGKDSRYHAQSEEEVVPNVCKHGWKNVVGDEAPSVLLKIRSQIIIVLWDSNTFSWIELEISLPKQESCSPYRGLCYYIVEEYIQFGQHESKAQGYSCAETNFPEPELGDL